MARNAPAVLGCQAGDSRELALDPADAVEEGALEADALADAGRLDEAIAACEALIGRYGSDRSSVVEHSLARVMVIRSWCLFLGFRSDVGVHHEDSAADGSKLMVIDDDARALKWPASPDA
jgi:hypothetical protein